MPPIVEYPDSLDFEISGNANKVGPGISYNDNPEALTSLGKHLPP